MEWSIPIWNLGISTMDSMEQVHMESIDQIQMELMTITFTVSLLFLVKINLHFHGIEPPATTQRTMLKPPEPQRLCYT